MNTSASPSPIFRTIHSSNETGLVFGSFARTSAATIRPSKQVTCSSTGSCAMLFCNGSVGVSEQNYKTLTVHPVLPHADIADSLVRPPVVGFRQRSVEHVVKVGVVGEDDMTTIVEKKAFRRGVCPRETTRRGSMVHQEVRSLQLVQTDSSSETGLISADPSRKLTGPAPMTSVSISSTSPSCSPLISSIEIAMAVVVSVNMGCNYKPRSPGEAFCSPPNFAYSHARPPTRHAG